METNPTPPKERPILAFFKKLSEEGTELVKEQTESAKTDLALELKRSVQILGLFIIAAIFSLLALSALAGFLILLLNKWIESWIVVMGISGLYGALAWFFINKARQGIEGLNKLSSSRAETK